MKDCIFCKIVNGQIPKDFTYQDEFVAVFPDLHPMAPIHLLIIPKKHVKEFYEVEDAQIFMHIGAAIQKMIEKNGLHKTGYKIEVNGGGRQDIDHLHFHLLGNETQNSH